MRPGNETFSRGVVKYGAGFIGSLLLTVAAYLVATGRWPQIPMELVAFVLLALAIIQLLLQLRFFLHVGSEPSPKWQSQSLVFTVLMLLVVVIGSLWIMINLNYRMGMTPEQMQEYMLEQNRKGF